MTVQDSPMVITLAASMLLIGNAQNQAVKEDFAFTYSGKLCKITTISRKHVIKDKPFASAGMKIYGEPIELIFGADAGAYPILTGFRISYAGFKGAYSNLEKIGCGLAPYVITSDPFLKKMVGAVGITLNKSNSIMSLAFKAGDAGVSCGYVYILTKKDIYLFDHMWSGDPIDLKAWSKASLDLYSKHGARFHYVKRK